MLDFFDCGDEDGFYSCLHDAYLPPLSDLDWWKHMFKSRSKPKLTMAMAAVAERRRRERGAREASVFLECWYRAKRGTPLSSLSPLPLEIILKYLTEEKEG